MCAMALAIARLAASFAFALCFLVHTHDASLDIASGYSHNCVFEAGQTGMKCWGDNQYGQLGYEDTNNRGDEPGEMGANLTIVSLGPSFIVNATGLGVHHSCAKSQEKAVTCWGRGDYYQLGHETQTNVGDGAGEMGANLATVQFSVAFLPFRIALGLDQSCVVSTDSLLVCFGRNVDAQCGSGTRDEFIIGPPSNIAAVDLGSNFTPIDIATFYVHVCAISQQQTIKCFGDNWYGQLGYGDQTIRGQTPQSMGDGLPEVSLGSNFTPKAVAVGSSHTCVLSVAKTLKCFGYNWYGQCGQATQATGGESIGDGRDEMGDNLPIVIFPADFVPIQMALGHRHTCILSENGHVVCFGQNNYGQLGLGHTTSTVDMAYNLAPVDLGTNFVPRRITAGHYHTCAISTMDDIKCWGRNNYGQLGLGHNNTVGDEPNEMADNLPFVDVAFPAPTTTTPTSATPTPTTAEPTTATPTTVSPTTPAPSTAEPTTAEPTTAVPTTAQPTTAVPTAPAPTTTVAPTMATTLTTTATATATEYRVTIEFRSASCADILVTVTDALDASLAQVTVDEEACEDGGDDVGEPGSDVTTTATLLVAIADVQLDSDVIQSTLREAMVQEYGEDIVDVGVEEEEADEEDTQSHAGVKRETTVIIAACTSALFIAVVCICAAAFYYVRKNYVRVDRRLSENVAAAQVDEEAQQARNEIDNDAEVRVPPGVVAYARENAHVEDTRGEDNLSLPAQECVLSVDARRRENNQNIELAIAEVRMEPGVFAHAREDMRGEDNLSLPAQESVLCVDEEEGNQGIAAHNQERRQSQQQHDGDATPLQTAVATSGATDGATAGIDPSLGVYELNLMVDL